MLEHLTGCLDRLLQSFDTNKGIDLNVGDVMIRYSTDLIYTCFYRQPNLIEYDLNKKDYYSSTIEKGLGDIYHPALEVSLSFPLLSPFLEFYMNKYNDFGAMKNKVIDFVKQQTVLNLQARAELSQAKKTGTKVDLESVELRDGQVYKRNMIDPFIDNYHDGKIGKTEYLHTSFFLLLAAVKTVADAMTRLLYYLAIHVEVQEKLRKSIKEEGLDSKYLGWCINEVLRLEPPAPIGSSRRLEQDFEVEGGVVPRGTFVQTATYTIHRLPECWGEDANQFRPERWERANKFHPAQFIPFGGGLRGCPGKEFAMYDMRKVMQALLSRYKFERSSKTSDSGLFKSPLFIFLIHESSIYIKISAL